MIDIVVEKNEYMDSKYQVFGFQQYDLGDMDITENTATDDPRKAIKLWCAATAKNPGDAAIMAEDKAAACELIDWAYDNLDKVMAMMNAVNRFPYKKDYIIDEIKKQHENRCRYFSSKYPDSIHPFGVG